MDNLNYQVTAPSAPDLPPYSEKHPYHQQPPPVYGPANPAMPTPYQPYYVPYVAVSGQGPISQPLLQTTTVVPVQSIEAPDYLGYSIVTMLCCCLPLGITALVFSILTRDANRKRNGTAAQQYSRMAQAFAHSALGVGIVIITVYTVLIVVGRRH